MGGETRLVGAERESFPSVGVVFSPIHQLEKTLIVIPSGKKFSQGETFAYFVVFGQVGELNSFFDVAKIDSRKIFHNL